MSDPAPRRLTAVWLMTAVLAAVLPRVGAAGDAGDAATPAIGARGHVGCGPDPRRVRRLSITEPGVYENILVDGEWTDGTLVKITADGVTLRNCEVRNGTHNAVAVYAKDVGHRLVQDPPRARRHLRRASATPTASPAGRRI